MLLKRWKHLEAGYRSSSDAYQDLCDHFKDNTNQWHLEEIDAQNRRQGEPASMDIYDMVKKQGVTSDPVILAHSNPFDQDHPELIYSIGSLSMKMKDIQFMARHPGFHMGSRSRKCSMSAHICLDIHVI